MSEKRFVYGRAFAINSDDSLPCITDRQDEKDYIKMSDLVDLLNEQHSDLIYLARFIGEFKVEEFRLKLRDLRILEDKVLEQQATINKLNDEKDYWKNKAMTLLMQVRRLTPRMTDKEVKEFSKELDDE